MAELSTVARPYAEALFSAACDDKAGLPAWSDLVGEMSQVASNPDVREAMADPRLGDKQRVELFTGLIKAELPQAARNFIALLVENDRLSLLPDIATQFAALRNRHDGTAQAEITSAFELSDAQVQELVAALEQKFGLKLKPSVTVDPSLIGGVRVAVGTRCSILPYKPNWPACATSSPLKATNRIPGVNMQLNPSEISELLKSRIEGLGASTDVRTQGTVVSVTDGITRIHGLSDVMQGEMLEFPNNVFGLALNLERDSVGAVILGDYTGVSEGDQVKTTGRILEVPVGPELRGRVVNTLGLPIDGKGPINAKETDIIEKVAPALSPAARCRSRCRPAPRLSTPWCRSAAASAS